MKKKFLQMQSVTEVSGIAPYRSILMWWRGYNHPRNLLTKADTLSAAIVQTKSYESFLLLLIKDKCYKQQLRKIFSNLNGLFSILTELRLQSLVRSMEKNFENSLTSDNFITKHNCTLDFLRISFVLVRFMFLWLTIKGRSFCKLSVG